MELSLAYCLGTETSGLTLPWLGRVLDRWGERKMAVASVAATGAVLFYLAACAPISHGLGRVLPAGFAAVCGDWNWLLPCARSGAGVLSMTCRNAIGKWFDHRRGLAMAISSILVSFSFSMSPKWIEWLKERHGYDGAWIIMGLGTIFIMGPLAWLLFRDTPEDDGLLMDGGAKPAAHNNPDMHIEREFTRDEAVRDYSFWVFNAAFGFWALFGTAFTFHATSLGEEYGFTRERIINLCVPIAATSVTTNLLFGAINAKLRLKFLLLVMNLGCIAAAIGMLNLKTSVGVAAYVIGNGIASGGFVSLSGIVFPRFYGREHLGAIGGLNMSVMVIGSGLGPCSWRMPAFCGQLSFDLIACGIIPTVLALLSLWADNPQRRFASSDS